MIKHTQTIHGSGTIGDCFRTCVACLLDLEIEDVPHFVADEESGEGEQWWVAFGKWLEKRGLAAISLHDGVSTAICLDNKGIYCIACGKGPRGERHAIVGRMWADESEIHFEEVWDPHPSRDGLMGEEDRYVFLLLRSPWLCGTK